MIFNFFQSLFAFVVVLAPLVFIHELGHFLAAKAFRIGVPVFSLGFGPRLFGFRSSETDYRVSLVPLGGYVRLAGDEADENRTGAEHEFLSRPRYQRFVVFVAGAVFNIILAFVVLWAFFGIYGKQEVPEIYPTIFEVEAGSTSEIAGILAGDRIIEIDGRDVKIPDEFLDAFLMQIKLAPQKQVPIRIERDGESLDLTLDTGLDPEDGSGAPGWSFNWIGAEPAEVRQVVMGYPADEAGFQIGDRIVAVGEREPIPEFELRRVILDSADQPLAVTVERDGQRVELTVTPRFEGGRGGIVGLDFRRNRHRELSITEAAQESWRTNVALSKTLFVILKRLVTTEVSIKTMSGPIGIAQYARQALITGPDALLWMLGFFSLQLGILNLLPIPVLDGGHILILGVESAMRRDLSDRLKERVMQVGFVFLLAFMGLIIVQDVIKSF